MYFSGLAYPWAADGALAERRGRDWAPRIFYGAFDPVVNVRKQLEGDLRNYLGVSILLSTTFPAIVNAAIPETWPKNDLLTGETWRVETGMFVEHGFVPTFRASERDRARLAVWGEWWPSPRVRIDARYEGIQDHHPDGRVVSGSGDLDLGVYGSVLRGANGSSAWTLGVGWRAKLPNAADERELGTDETDIVPLLQGAVRARGVEADFNAGIAILGNPLRYASQDDVPFAGLGVGLMDLPRPAPRLRLGADWAFATQRNPARGQVDLDLDWGHAWRVGIEGRAGLSPAAPDLSGGAWFGYGGFAQNRDVP